MPEITIVESPNPLVITIEVPGPPGPKGDSIDLAMGDVFTGDPGTDVIATVTGTAPNKVLNLTVPRGATGAPGTDGLDGVTDHGALTGLADDDHTQYHTDARGDARYSQLGHTHTKSEVGLANVDNTSDTAKPVSTAQQAALDLKANLASPTFTGTVSGITKAMVGLANVDNTTDAAKPVSTAQQTALDLKANLASPTFTGTVGGITKSMVGLGSVDNTSDAAKPVSTAQQAALDLKANLASPTFTGTVSGITKSMVGLANVDNTADTAKPVSTAQQTALDLKANLASPTFTGTVSGITKSMVGLANVDNTADTAKPVSTAQQTALDLKADKSTTITAGTGLSGGGDFSANRTLTVSYGSTSGTAVQGNDARVTADQAAGTASIRTIGTGALQAAAGNHTHTSKDVTNPAVSLTDGATIATDASLGRLFRVSIAGNRTLLAPSNAVDGMRIMYEITASAADRTLTMTTGSSGAFAFGTDFTSIPTITSGTTTFIGCVYSSRSSRWHILAVGSGH